MSRITHTVSTETALQVVAHQRCRSVLTQLIESESNAITLDALVEHVAPENPPPEPVGAAGTEQLRLDLHHTHLPKLEDAGIIEYNERTETVRYHPDERVEKLYQFVTAELE